MSISIRSMTRSVSLQCALCASGLACGCASARDLRSDDPVKADLAPVRIAALNVTNGQVSPLDEFTGQVRAPSMRAVGEATNPSTVALDFTYLGPSDASSKLASGEERSQFGLKVRAANTCNVLYVMWRADARGDAGELAVSVKSNPGATTHAECADRGYTRLRPLAKPDALPRLKLGDKHRLVAQVDHNALNVRVDGKTVWSGPLSQSALQLTGPAGVRTDNVKLDFSLYVRA